MHVSYRNRLEASGSNARESSPGLVADGPATSPRAAREAETAVRAEDLGDDRRERGKAMSAFNRVSDREVD